MILVVLCGAAQAQTFSVIHTFSGPDGRTPVAGPTLDKYGDLYGTTWGGGAGNYGTLYKLTPVNGSWLLNEVYNFTGLSDGGLVNGGVTIGPDGTLFGTTEFANGGSDAGTLYNVKPGGKLCMGGVCQWTDTTLHTFAGGSDGATPVVNVVFDSHGNLYGTTYYGGTYNDGTVFKGTLSGGTWNVSVIYTFGAPGDGVYPWAPVIVDSAGNLYGTTEIGGPNGYGTVFELSPSQGGWTETILHSFSGSDGCLVGAGVVFDGAGNLYGATGYCPTIFEMTPQGGGWNFTTLYTFPGTGPYHGPSSSLAVDSAGNLYGTTENDGAYGYGNVFEMSPSSGGWTYTDLYDFTGGNDGSQPYGSVVVTGPGGFVYGTTLTGGANGDGVIFQINLGTQR
ncbi:MAG TPA: choice-of-anchor tandem repeat GloVer-containing protein [Candidatus Bathyarchaeia archaeon]|nr:choice-of-anchor tandem repeat GloVer-containing protein [Candidatus Bathyarchaeia archaeon]